MPYVLAPLWKTKISSLSEEERWEHLQVCLKAYDWYYAMSDDHGVWRSGEDQRAHLEQLMETLAKTDGERVQEMYDKASPWRDEEN